MADNKYYSIYTGAEIDQAVTIARVLNWKTEAVVVSSGVTSVNFSLVRDYPLIVLTGYKAGIGVDRQTASVIVSTTALQDRGAGVQDEVHVPLAARNEEYRAWVTSLFFWFEGNLLKWQTATDYGGDTSFVVTRIEGLKITKNVGEEE